MPCAHERRRLVQWLRAEMVRTAGQAYPQIDPDALDVDSLRELQRLLRDLDAERDRAVQRARLAFWRWP